MAFHGDDPEREGNLSSAEYWRRAEARGRESGPCHPPPADEIVEYPDIVIRSLAGPPEPVLTTEQAAEYQRLLTDGRAQP